MSQIVRSDGKAEMQRGEEYDVVVKLPYGEECRDKIVVGMPFNLNIGSRVVATGFVKEIS